jgi:hypothetical protein
MRNTLALALLLAATGAAAAPSKTPVSVKSPAKTAVPRTEKELIASGTCKLYHGTTLSSAVEGTLKKGQRFPLLDGLKNGFYKIEFDGHTSWVPAECMWVVDEGAPPPPATPQPGDEEEPAPTATARPTPKATPKPTEDGEEPTAVPTRRATAAPSPEAEEEPTAVPTRRATAIPTDEPTEEPTEEPTAVPTRRPTPVPTDEATPETRAALAPTAEATEEPTAIPTRKPTPAPTEAPTEAPTDEPTAVPTRKPTLAPTDEPTAIPTRKPTLAPTDEPTLRPTAVPPTAVPTAAPTPEIRRAAVVTPYPTRVPTRVYAQPTYIVTPRRTVAPTPRRTYTPVARQQRQRQDPNQAVNSLPMGRAKGTLTRVQLTLPIGGGKHLPSVMPAFKPDAAAADVRQIDSAGSAGLGIEVRTVRWLRLSGDWTYFGQKTKVAVAQQAAPAVNVPGTASVTLPDDATYDMDTHAFRLGAKLSLPGARVEPWVNGTIGAWAWTATYKEKQGFVDGFDGGVAFGATVGTGIDFHFPMGPLVGSVTPFLEWGAPTVNPHMNNVGGSGASWKDTYGTTLAPPSRLGLQFAIGF